MRHHLFIMRHRQLSIIDLRRFTTAQAPILDIIMMSRVIVMIMTIVVTGTDIGVINHCILSAG
jgi:hypothetical protein